MRVNLFLILMYFLSTSILAQQKTISGTVSADSGPLPGVSIIIKGTTNGTDTDFDGKYVINTKIGDVLVFRYLGFSPLERTVNNSNTINVTLVEGGEILDEIVVTAFGIKRNAKSLGYAVSTVNSEQLVDNSEPDLLRSLNGKVAGVNINVSTGVAGAANRINIRGVTSIQGGNQPLFVVDGTPYSNQEITTSNQTTGNGGSYESGISTLDPNDIDDVQVLKGGAAAALYGSRAVNGVVIITTKSGKSGGFTNKKSEVSLSSGLYFEDIANLPDYQNTYGNGTNFNYNNANGSWGARFDSRETIPTWGPLLAAFPDQFGPTVPYVAQPDNVKNLFKTGIVTDNSVNFRASGDNGNFSMTISNLDQEGYIPFNTYTRTNFSTGGNFKLENGLRIGANFSYSDSKQVGPFLGENQFANSSSSFARTLVLGRTWDFSLPYEDPAGGSVTPNDGGFDHPLWSWEHNQIITNSKRNVVNVNFNYALNDHISFSYQLGLNNYGLNRKEITDLGSEGAAGLGAIVEEDFSSEEIESTFITSFDYDLTEDLNLTFLAGHNINQVSTRDFQYTGTALIAPGIFSVNNNSNIVSDFDLSTIQRLVGVFGNIGFGYKDYLFLNATARNDWSSTLPVANNSFLYPSVSSSLIFTEAFDIGGDVLTFGKLRASWANVGRFANAYQINKTFNVDPVFNGQNTFSIPIQLGNPDLLPENTEEIELGLDLEFFNRRAVVDFSWYKKNTTDLISAVTVPTSTGYRSSLTNIGEIENTGIEIGLTLVPIKTKNFSWTSFTAFTKNDNKVLSLVEGLDQFPLDVQLQAFVAVGQPFGVFYGTSFARDDEGNYLIEEGGGGILQDLDATKKIGDPNPDFKIGFTNTFKYKSLSLSAQIDWREGGDIISSGLDALLGRGVTRDTEDRERTFILPGFYGDPATGLPRLDSSGNKIPNVTQVTLNNLYFSPTTDSNTFGINSVDEASVYDGTVYRLREISLAYDVPKQFLEKTGLGSVNISIVGNNLWYFAPNVPKYTNFDPDVTALGSTNVQGIETQSAPSSKRYGVKVKLTF